MLLRIWRVGVRRTGPDTFQWCPATGQGTTGTNWSIGSSIWTQGRTSSLWGWRSTGTGCPGRLWSLLLWRYSRPTWMRSCAACCRRPCFSRGLGLDDPQRSLPTPTILWYYCRGQPFPIFNSLKPLLISNLFPEYASSLELERTMSILALRHERLFPLHHCLLFFVTVGKDENRIESRFFWCNF